MMRDLPVIQSNDACCRDVREPVTMPEPDRERLLATFKALADGTRLDVFRLIAAQREPICACDVVDRFDVSQPTIAHHLKVLRQAGLITSTRRGIWAYYAVDPAGERELALVATALGLERELVLR